MMPWRRRRAGVHRKSVSTGAVWNPTRRFHRPAPHRDVQISLRRRAPSADGAIWQRRLSMSMSGRLGPDIHFMLRGPRPAHARRLPLAERSSGPDIVFRLGTPIRTHFQSLILRWQSDHRRNDSGTSRVVPSWTAVQRLSLFRRSRSIRDQGNQPCSIPSGTASVALRT
jgi:hypothetical protein